MWLSKGLELLFLCHLITLGTCINLLDFAREELVAMQVQHGIKTPSAKQSNASYPIPTEELLPSSWQPVTVQCDEAEMVIYIHRDLFGNGNYIQTADLQIGSQACLYTTINDSDIFIIIKVGLHECGSNLQTTSDSLLYHTSLYYAPSPKSNLIIVRKTPVEIPIVCSYPRANNVSSKAIEPTWFPFSSTLSEEGKLYFSLHLMTDDWQAERTSPQYLLGDDLHIQADIKTGHHLPLRLFVDACMATLTPDKDSAPSYTILSFYGCLIDGRSQDVESSFIIPRLRQETLQFTVPSFQFAGDGRNLIYITCHLKVTAADREPDLVNKACSFNRQRKVWSPVEGSEKICNCCETRDCGTDGWHKSNNTSNLDMPRQRKQMTSAKAVVDISRGEMGADLVVGPVLILKPAWNHQRDHVRMKEGMLAEGQAPVIEAEAESAVGHHFILKADKELRWLLDSNKTMKDELLHMASRDGATTELTHEDESLQNLSLPLEVAKMSLQGNASEKESIQRHIQATIAGILFLLFSSIA